MIDDFLTQATHDRIEAMQIEAQTYRLMIERANLQFGPPVSMRVRRAAARLLLQLAQRVSPHTDGLQFQLRVE